MEATEHTFPLPETEKLKLETVTGPVRRRDPLRGVTRFIRLHIWKMAVLGCATGLALGLVLGSRAR